MHDGSESRATCSSETGERVDRVEAVERGLPTRHPRRGTAASPRDPRGRSSGDGLTARVATGHSGAGTRVATAQPVRPRTTGSRGARGSTRCTFRTRHCPGAVRDDGRCCPVHCRPRHAVYFGRGRYVPPSRGRIRASATQHARGGRGHGRERPREEPTIVDASSGRARRRSSAPKLGWCSTSGGGLGTRPRQRSPRSSEGTDASAPGAAHVRPNPPEPRTQPTPAAAAQRATGSTGGRGRKFPTMAEDGQPQPGRSSSGVTISNAQPGQPMAPPPNSGVEQLRPGTSNAAGLGLLASEGSYPRVDAGAAGGRDDSPSTAAAGTLGSRDERHEGAVATDPESGRSDAEPDAPTAERAGSPTRHRQQPGDDEPRPLQPGEGAGGDRSGGEEEAEDGLGIPAGPEDEAGPPNGQQPPDGEAPERGGQEGGEEAWWQGPFANIEDRDLNIPSYRPPGHSGPPLEPALSSAAGRGLWQRWPYCNCALRNPGCVRNNRFLRCCFK
ncbi:hypothetical protein [Thrips tabaci associated dsRNA virus 2]|uniref:Uncharacterized protein n=1 Tax=Thrips tabaci associated dsRNA virus 2 TaxID=2771480 RepID=A0A7H1D334_9VIRU|nr:hypothetical protein [Thrips tabaci associated dsRNA virus 2]